MEYYTLCCDENGNKLEFNDNNNHYYCSFYLTNKPKIGDRFHLYQRLFTIEEISEDYSKAFLSEIK